MRSGTNDTEERMALRTAIREDQERFGWRWKHGMSEESEINPSEIDSYDTENQLRQERVGMREEVGNGENEEFIVNYDRIDDEKKKYILEKVVDLTKKDDLPYTQNLRRIGRLKMKDKTRLVHEVIGLIETHDITETNKLIECGALVITQLFGEKEIKKKKQEGPFWKRRIEEKIQALCLTVR